MSSGVKLLPHGASAEAPFGRMAFPGVNLQRSLYPTAARGIQLGLR